MVLEQGIPHNLLQTFEGIVIVKNEMILGGEAWLSGNNTNAVHQGEGPFANEGLSQF